MSLHGHPIIETARLPDGRSASIRVGVAEDSYVADRDMTMVVLEVRVDRELAAIVDTILDPAQVQAARHLAARVRDGLSSGELDPTAGSLDRLAEDAAGL